MSEIVFMGKTHVFPDGIDKETIGKMLRGYMEKQSKPQAGKPLLQGVGDTNVTWKNMQETPEQRRRAAEISAAIMRQEAQQSSDPLLQPLINQADAVSVAKDPHKTATSLKTYRRFLYGD